MTRLSVNPVDYGLHIYTLHNFKQEKHTKPQNWSVFCKKILNKTLLEVVCSILMGPIPIGGAVKIIQMLCGFFIENLFFHKYISSSIQNPRVIQGIYKATPIRLSPLKLDTQPSINVLLYIFWQN